MKRRTLRDIGMARPCPKCGSGPNVACLRKNGKRRLSVHRERICEKLELQPEITGPFYQSDEWRRVRYQALLKASGMCQCCGARPMKGKALHVDHIKPRSKFPELQLSVSNLQVLCEDCNLGKSNWDQTDWRRA